MPTKYAKFLSIVLLVFSIGVAGWIGNEYPYNSWSEFWAQLGMLLSLWMLSSGILEFATENRCDGEFANEWQNLKWRYRLDSGVKMAFLMFAQSYGDRLTPTHGRPPLSVGTAAMYISILAVFWILTAVYRKCFSCPRCHEDFKLKAISGDFFEGFVMEKFPNVVCSHCGLQANPSEVSGTEVNINSSELTS